jgi:hypothetical protein
MVTVLLINGKQLRLSRNEAVEFVSRADLNTVFGFQGSEDWVEKIAYYAGKRKFDQDTEVIKTFARSGDDMKEFLLSRGELSQKSYDELRGQKWR